jgi:hypothetical protein
MCATGRLRLGGGGCGGGVGRYVWVTEATRDGQGKDIDGDESGGETEDIEAGVFVVVMCYQTIMPDLTM